MAPSDPITAHQPLKAFFVAANVLYLLFIQLPILGLYYLYPTNRQDATWSWKQAIGVSTGKFLFNLGAIARFARVFPVDKAPKDPKKVFIPAMAQTKLSGVLLDADVKPADLMGEWYPNRFGEDGIKRGTKVILFMFGGAYVMGDPNPAIYATTLNHLCPALNAKFLIIGYRLAGSAGGQPFPSQLQDLLSAYQYLLSSGVISKNIILAGESAGGNAVLSFLRYLEDARLRLKDRRYITDFAAVKLVQWGQQAFVPMNRAVSDEYISPALKLFHSRVPIWMEAGEGEVVFDELHQFAGTMRQVGTDFEFFAVPHGTHAQMWAAGMVGFDVKGSVKSFAAFFKNRDL